MNEFVCAKRDAVLSVALRDLEIGVVFQSLSNLKEVKDNDESALEKFGPVADIFKTMIMQLLTKNLTLVSCLTLDTLKNRKTVGVTEEETPSTNEVFGFEYNAAMFNWIKNNLTMKQEQTLLEKIFEVNDFVELVKNYSALVTKVMKSSGKNQT